MWFRTGLIIVASTAVSLGAQRPPHLSTSLATNFLLLGFLNYAILQYIHQMLNYIKE